MVLGGVAIGLGSSAPAVRDDPRGAEIAMCEAISREFASRLRAGGSVYEIIDDDAHAVVVANDFGDAITRWRRMIRRDNPSLDVEDMLPNSVTRICRPDEFYFELGVVDEN